MKKAFFAFALSLFCLVSSIQAQTQTTKPAPKPNVSMDANGNYVALASQKAETQAKPTGKTFTTTDGQVLPVYQGKTGSLYVLRTSKKTGKEYRYYLRTN